MSDLQTAKQRLTEAARLDEFAYQGVWEDVTAVLAALAAPSPAPQALTETLPMQPIVRDAGGVVRFRANRIVRYLLDCGPFTMNDIGRQEFATDDQRQFAQLIGYSVSGYGELSYAEGHPSVEQADSIAATLATPSPAVQPAEPPADEFWRNANRVSPGMASLMRALAASAPSPAAVPAQPAEPESWSDMRRRGDVLRAEAAQPADRAEPAPLTDAKELARMWLTTHYADEHTADEIEAKCWAILGHPDEATKAGFRAFATRSQP